MTDPIPDDIRAKAEAIACQWRDAGFSPEDIAQSLMQEREAERARWQASDEAGRESGLMLGPIDLAEAVMQERERCAKIADAYAKDSWGLTEEETAAMNIAITIRSPDTSTQGGIE